MRSWSLDYSEAASRLNHQSAVDGKYHSCTVALHTACQPQLVAMAMCRAVLHLMCAELAALYAMGTQRLCMQP